LLLEPDSRYGAQLISTLHHLNKKVYRKDCAVVLIALAYKLGNHLIKIDYRFAQFVAFDKII
jgi:hypothetical protein